MRRGILGEGAPQCAKCEFFEIEGYTRYCVRYPPKVFYNVEEDRTLTRYPEVSETQWCGEFRAGPRRAGSA